MRTTQRNQRLHLSDGTAAGPQITTQRTLPSAPPTARLLRIKSVLDRVPVSRSQLYNFIAAGIFPKPIHVGGGQASFWVEAEVNGWIQSQIDTQRRAA